MQSFKSFITESVKMPDGPHALKIRNHIVKHFGGKGHNDISPNPYVEADHKSVSGIANSKHDHLIKHLEAHGFKKKHEEHEDSKPITASRKDDTVIGHTTPKHHTTLEHENGARIHVTKDLGEKSEKFGAGKTHVHITGKKKAKSTTLPYYD